VPPGGHPRFYAASRFTLNVTRADMIAAGYSPSVRLFEAGACGAPIISDEWEGLETLLRPGREVLLAADTDAVLAILRDLPDVRRRAIADAGRRRILGAHTARHRAAELEEVLRGAGVGQPRFSLAAETS
jgi:spore maturation protein CgeB